MTSYRYRFDRMEVAGSLGDIGTLLPLAIGMIFINGLSPLGIFLSIGLFYILSGVYFGLPVPVQPMKVIGAYAVATSMNASQISASIALMGAAMLFIGATGLINVIGKYIPKAVVRGVQMSTGTLLMAEGVRLMMGISRFQVLRQSAEPYLSLQSIGPLPIGIIIGIAGGILTLLLLDNRKVPAGLVVVIGGLFVGMIMGTRVGFAGFEAGFNLPSILPFGFPSGADFTFALFALVIPQIPMTLGNAVVAYSDLSELYFNKGSKRVSYKGACISMALANFFSFLVGGIPLCHGAGGLAAHYRFGARTAGSNIIIGCVFVVLAVFLGNHSLAVVNLIPMSVLGVLLLFAGSQLAMTIVDIEEKKELFVVLLILGITLASNLAAGFIAGIGVAYAIRSDRLKV